MFLWDVKCPEEGTKPGERAGRRPGRRGWAHLGCPAWRKGGQGDFAAFHNFLRRGPGVSCCTLLLGTDAETWGNARGVSGWTREWLNTGTGFLQLVPTGFSKDVWLMPAITCFTFWLAWSAQAVGLGALWRSLPTELLHFKLLEDLDMSSKKRDWWSSGALVRNQWACLSGWRRAS